MTLSKVEYLEVKNIEYCKYSNHLFAYFVFFFYILQDEFQKTHLNLSR